jgi:hypothetical protein
VGIVWLRLVRRVRLLEQIDTGQEFAVRGAGRSRIGQPGLFVGRDRGPALTPDPGDKLPLDVERDHRHAVLTREMKQRQVERRVVAPDRRPVHRLEEGLGIEIAVHPPVQDRLDAPRETLEPQDHVGVAAMQGGQGVQLPTVVFGVVVRLAEKDDRPPSQRGHELFRGERPRGRGIEPRPGRHATASVRILDLVGTDRQRHDGGGQCSGEKRPPCEACQAAGRLRLRLM